MWGAAQPGPGRGRRRRREQAGGRAALRARRLPGGPAASLLASGASPGAAAAFRGLAGGSVAVRARGLTGGGGSPPVTGAPPRLPQLAELKQECLARGLEAKGNKQDLIHRLQAYLEEHGGPGAGSRAGAGGILPGASPGSPRALAGERDLWLRGFAALALVLFPS